MSSNQPTSNMMNVVSNALASSNPFIEVFSTRDPTTSDVNYPIQKRWFNKTEKSEWILVGFTSSGGVLQAVWEQISGESEVVEFTVDAATAPGVNPVTPDGSGNVTVTADVVAAHSIPIRIHTTALNQYAIETQYSSAIAATDATKVGLSNFNSAHFSVDANGFVSSLGAGFPWTDVSGAVNAAVNNGYFVIGICTSTLPSSPSQGDTIKYIVDHASQLLTIQASAGKIIRLGNTVTAAAGTAVSTLQGDSIELVYRNSDQAWISLASTGQWNLT